MATIIDVAKRAGVAVTTVSRVINDKGQVSAETRDRVRLAIDELGYRPSPAARSLPRKRAHAVSILVPFVTHPSAVARVQGIVHGLRNSLIPVTTSLGMIFAAMLTGTFVIEKIFAVPGLGRYFVFSITNRDYTAVMGLTILSATIMVVAVFLIDLIYLFLDPRIKLYD